MPAMLPQVMRENGWSSIFMPIHLRISYAPLDKIELED
jgi:hypothetical protein